MKISKEARRIARELFRESFSNGRLDAAKASAFSDKLIAARPRNFESILREFTRLVRFELERRHATIESATALDAAELAKLQKEIPATFGDDVTLEFVTNPQLLGGLRVKVGSDVWDGSVSARLEALSKQL